MSRELVRQMRTTVSHGLVVDASEESLERAQRAAAQLLERSVALGHRRLSVVRLSVAAQCGAAVPMEHWNYCYSVARSSGDPRIRSLFLDAAHAAQQEFCLPAARAPVSA